MMFRAAIALLALAVPAFAQHGGVHAGSIGGRGFSGPAGFSSHPAFSGSPGFARPAPAARYGSVAGFRTYGQPGPRSPYYGNRFAAGRSSPGRFSYNPRAAGLSRGRNPDRDRFDARRRQFHNWYVSTYPYWAGYPYLIDPNAYNLGLYDWDDSDNSASDTSQSDSYESNQYGPAPLYPPPYPEEAPPYPNQGYAAPVAEAGAAVPAVSDQFLTVIFKNGRAPIKVRNYLMTAKVLTDLDSQHYEQIPLDQIDLAATVRINTAAGVDFQVPGASRD
ncbi:MAG: hypothetical protein WCF30_13335 [Terracidiphilus sp.]